jgi:hypothetical protein
MPVFVYAQNTVTASEQSYIENPGQTSIDYMEREILDLEEAIKSKDHNNLFDQVKHEFWLLRNEFIRIKWEGIQAIRKNNLELANRRLDEAKAKRDEVNSKFLELKSIAAK